MITNCITAPDEKFRCCFLPDGDVDKRCLQKSRFVIYGTPYSWDDYTHTCGDHVIELKRDGDKIYKLCDDGTAGEEIK
jgi:hypothetical protein